jgi:hypothetical protein
MCGGSAPIRCPWHRKLRLVRLSEKHCALLEIWGRDYALVSKGQMKAEAASFRVQHRNDYAQIRIERIALDD